MRSSSGHFAGPQALAAVTLMFPLYMLIVALATLVSSGMSSILARQLGAWRVHEARATYSRGAWARRSMGLVLIALFLAFGKPVALLAAGGSEDLAEMGLVYLRITVFAAPLIFVLSVNSDALRNEGLVMFMAAMSLLVSLGNMGFNYVLIGLLGHGRGGLGLWHGDGAGPRARHHPGLPHLGRHGAAPVRALAAIRRCRDGGASSRSARRKASTSSGLRSGRGRSSRPSNGSQAPDYDATVSAYGIVTRLITFAFLPLLGLAHAMQTITGNNYGAGAFHRSDASLRTAVISGLRLLPCAADRHDGLRGADRCGLRPGPGVIGEVARILPVISAGFFAAGPLMMIAMHFQAIGDAGRAAILGLSKPYLFAMPLTFALAGSVG
jgi:Na+-driven multidrug efflux pump